MTPTLSPALPIADLLAIPKTVARTFRVSSHDPEHARFDLELAATCPGTFHVFVRVLRALHENFSIGLRFEPPSAGDVVLLRVNGDHGAHRNPDGGRIADGPHIHSFLPPLLGAAPHPGAEPKWAWPLPRDHTALPTAWRTFCDAISLTSTTKVDERIRTLYSDLSQLSFPNLPR